MAFQDPDEAFDNVVRHTVTALNGVFPLRGRDKSLHLEALHIDTAAKDPHDIGSQYKAKLGEETWSIPVHGTMVLKNEKGEVLDRKKIKILDLPRTTNRLSYIYRGQEHQVANQWQLRPGAYTRRRSNGELRTQFNVTGRAAFDLTFDPPTNQFSILYKKANMPAYPILKAMGVTDTELQQAWGKDIWEANAKNRRNSSTLAQFYRTSTNTQGSPTEQQALDNLHKVMAASKLHPDVTEITLGKRFESVEGDALTRASKRLLAVQAGQPEDDRDALPFKVLRATGELLHDQIKAAVPNVKMKMSRQLNKGSDKLHDIVTPGFLNPAVSALFQSALVNPAKQVSPLDMLGTAMQTTIMGPGGIRSETQVTDEAKYINPSHLGFIDPFATPEGSNTGVSLRLPIGVKLIGDQPHIPLYNNRTKKMEWVSPATAYKSKVALADQVEFVDGHPKPIAKKVKILGKDNEIVEGPLHEADYVMRSPSNMFALTSAMVPFVQNNSGGRVSMAIRHMEQSISLKDRDKPLVQVAGPAGDTFEKLFGHQIGHLAPHDGVVTKVTPHAIHVKGADGKSAVVQLYHNYPLNDSKSVFHSEALVKEGDKVKTGQPLADTNFTRGGVFAPGKNLRVAYMPYFGKNFEDSMVVTESAAKKLSSVHLTKHFLNTDDRTVFGKTKFQNTNPGLYRKEQYEHLDDQGFPKVGSKVQPGDPLLLALQPFTLKDRVGVGALRKSLTSQHTDKSLRWEGETEGEVVAVHKSPKGVHIHVKSVEPLQIADKLCFDENTEVLTRTGWKPVSKVNLQDEVCTLLDGEIRYSRPSEVHSYAEGGRMYSLETQQIDLLVTANHRMYVQESTRDRERPYKLVRADTLLGKRVRYKKDGNWAGRAAAVNGSGVLGLTGRDYLALLGMFLSEGCCVNAPESGTYGIDIAQVKPTGREELFAELDRMGVRYTKTPDRARIHSKEALAHFQTFGKCKDKFIPNEVFDYPKDDLDVLFRWLMWGDGHTKNDRPICYTTTSRRLADDVQRLCLHIGKAANIKVDPAHAFEQNGRTYWASERYTVRIINSKLAPEVNHHHAKKQNAQSERIIENYTGPVFCVTVPGHVLYVRRNGKPCWSGNSNRHGGKGVVGYIIPDHEAPKTKDGKPVDIIFNPLGLGGRMNVGQVYETLAGKIAEKTGKTYVVKNFDPHVEDWSQKMAKELKEHGISDKEELIDPKTGQSLGKVLVGPQHFIKLVHQAAKKNSVRAGMGLPKLPSDEKYDSLTFAPASGGGTGGQSYGQLGMYALLAHGAKNILRAAMTYKSEGEDPETDEAKKWKSQHVEAWMAMQKGLPLPPPKPTFAFHRFTEMLKGAGINVEKKGSEFFLSPMTDKQVLSMSAGAIKDAASAVHSKMDPTTNQYKPITGGIFDEKMTGGHGGTKWSHIPLSEPLPNPIFEEPIKKLLGITGPRFEEILQGKVKVNGKVGGHAIEEMLKGIKVADELSKTKAALNKAPPSTADALYRKARYLQALDKLGLKPEEAYVLHNVPVLPPKLRPLSVMEDGALRFEDTNGFYMKLGQINSKLGHPAMAYLPEAEKAPFRMAVYDGVKALFGAGALPEGAKQKGLLQQIHGTSPKLGLFQQGLLSRRQDMSARGVIIPGPDLHLDQVGLPEKQALTLFRPFVVNQLVKSGRSKTTLEAQEVLSQVERGKSDPSVWSALNQVLSERPVLIKRDPALHKYSIQAFYAQAIPGNAIKLHPLVTGGFNADHDGDSIKGRVLLAERVHGTWLARSCDIKDFPRVAGSEHRSLGGTKEYDVPPSTYVFGMVNGSMRPCAVRSFSVHPGCVAWEVTFRSGRKVICSQDHSLAVLDTATLTATNCKPANSVGAAVPVLGRVEEHLSPSIPVHGREEKATEALGHALGEELALYDGNPLAQERCTPPQKYRSTTLLRTLLESAIIRPTAFRQGVLTGFLGAALDIDTARVDTTDPRALCNLLRSVGVPCREERDSVLLCRDSLYKASWFKPSAWNRKRLWRKGGKSTMVDLVPFPAWVADEIGEGVQSGWVERSTAARLYEAHKNPTSFVQAWYRMTVGGGLFWDEIVSVKETGDKEELYDLTVDESLNFVMDDGLLVWDTMSVYVPSSHDEVSDAIKMLPSKNLFNETTGAPAYTPSMEAQLGLHKLGRVGADTNHKFPDKHAAIDALALQKITVSDKIHVAGEQTTAGRILLAEAMPEAMQHRVRTDLGLSFNGKALKGLFSEVGKAHAKDFPVFADKMKELGYGAASGLVRTPLTKHAVVPVGAHSFGLSDFFADKEARDPVLQKAHADVEALKGLSKAEKDRRTVDIYLKASAEMRERHKKTGDPDNSLKRMNEAGVKPSDDQYQQLRLAPVVMKDSADRLIPTPIVHSFGEGLKMHEYWIGAYGARSGAVKKVQEVQDPGYMTKLLQNTSMSYLIDSHDCGTKAGISMPATHKDVVDRHLAADLKLGALHLPAGTLLDKKTLDHIVSVDPGAKLTVRSPLTCDSEKGVCQKCFGLSSNGKHHDLGTNIGVLSAHALGERAVQLTLKAFHSGGVATDRKGGAVGSFQRLEQLTFLPDKTPNSASLVNVNGKVTKIVPTPTGAEVFVGDHRHFVGKDPDGHYLHEDLPHADSVPGYQPWSPPKVGMEVKRGDMLSDPNRTMINPHRLYEATHDMPRVQRFLSDEMHKLYESEGVRKRAIEVVVKAMGNVTKIVDPHDHPDFLRGQFYPRSSLKKVNAERVAEGKPPVEHSPVLMGVDMLPLAATTDWMAVLNHQRLRGTLKENAALGAVSRLHGSHPVPGLAYGAEFGKPGVETKGKNRPFDY